MEIFYEWDVGNVVFPHNTWVYSNQFTSSDCGVKFNLALLIDIENNLIKMRVKKNDLRSARAGVQITLKATVNGSSSLGIAKDRFGNSFESKMYPTLIYVPDDFETRVSPTYTHDWKEFFTTDDFQDVVCMNYDTATIQDQCFIKNTTILCKITWHGFNPELPEADSLLSIQPCPATCVQQNFHDFFKSNEFSDITLVVENNELSAHKIVLSSHSPFFHKMLTSDMKESKENRIEVKNFTTEIITEMLEYIYTNKTKASSDFDVALKMIELAECYQISRLKEICEVTLLKGITIDNVLTLLTTADDFNVTKLRDESINLMINNIKKVVKLPDFENMFTSKPLLMHKFTVALGEKFHSYLHF